MSLTGIEFQSFEIVPALGMGFWDTLNDTLVETGLEVTMQSRHITEKPLQSIVTNRGIHVFHQLPGINPVNAKLQSSSVLRNFTFNVRDLENRFLPFSFNADCPSDGLYLPDCIQSLPLGNNYIPMFNASTRNVSTEMAVVRADLRNSVTQQPASWAMVTGEIDGKEVVRGVADKKGKLFLAFSYPEPETQLQEMSPPLSTLWRWSLKIRIFYSPVITVPVWPSLCNVMEQVQAQVILDSSTSVNEINVDLQLKQEKILRSENISQLLIEPV